MRDRTDGLMKCPNDCTTDKKLQKKSTKKRNIWVDECFLAYAPIHSEIWIHSSDPAMVASAHGTVSIRNIK